MKKSFTHFSISFLLAVFLFSGVVPAQAKENVWHTNFAKAQGLAKKENKRLLVHFTGSDWCVWCLTLKRDVYSQSQFKDYVDDKFVLVELDYPRTKELDEALKAQNEALLKKYDVLGMPTLLILEADGTKIGQLSYVQGGLDPFMEALKKEFTKATGG